MGIFDRISGLVGDEEPPEVWIEATDVIATNPHSIEGQVAPGEAVDVPVNLAAGSERVTFEAVEFTLVHVRGPEDRTDLFDRRVEVRVSLEPGEEHRFVTTIDLPETVPKSGELPTRIRARAHLEDGPGDEHTAYLDIGANPLLTAVRTALRVLGFSVADVEVVTDPDPADWPEAALDERFLLSLSVEPDDGGSPFTLVPVAAAGGDALDCYLRPADGDDWERVRVDDPEDPADPIAGALDRIGVRDTGR